MKTVSTSTIKAINGFVSAQVGMINVLGTLRQCVQNDLIRLGVTTDSIAKGFKSGAKLQGMQGEYVLDFAGCIAEVYSERCGVKMIAYNTRKGSIAIKPADMPKKGEEGYDDALAQMRTATQCLSRVFTFDRLPGTEKTAADKAKAFVGRFEKALKEMGAAERRLVKAQISAMLG